MASPACRVDERDQLGRHSHHGAAILGPAGFHRFATHRPPVAVGDDLDAVAGDPQ